MVHIRKINTMYGKKYAVVDLFTHYPTHLDKLGKPVVTKVTEYMTIDYQREKETVPAIFNLTAEGLKEAKEVQRLYKRRA